MTIMAFPMITVEDISAMADFREFRKTVITKARKIDGPFQVVTLEGIMTCNDGWLALDECGNPYPIDAEVFKKTYREIIRG
jgi:predicted amidohydrolase